MSHSVEMRLQILLWFFLTSLLLPFAEGKNQGFCDLVDSKPDGCIVTSIIPSQRGQSLCRIYGNLQATISPEQGEHMAVLVIVHLVWEKIN